MVTGYLHCLGQDVRVPADDTFKNIPLNKSMSISMKCKTMVTANSASSFVSSAYVNQWDKYGISIVVKN